MAFTERELEISNKSYTNKDFASIYEELLTAAEKLSTRFSPTTAVETDPFIVILKLAAFVADKVNYNVDKNVLERFISSCTQDQSMRELTETLGYNMHYYTAAETDLVFSYKLDDELSENIIIPKYTIVESASKIAYVTTLDSHIDKNTKTSANIRALQGKLQSLTILGNTLVQLENLNSNNRLYFPELMVAENGVFITNDRTNQWLKVDNLNTQTYGSTIYKFGFDSKRNLPYIEFPDWIADIIGEGLQVDYIVTDGVAGNVAAKELNTIAKRTVIPDDGISNDDIRVINLSASFSGDDPETIDESYLGFKKVIGTFDTLVTCRDYANAIYNMIASGSTIYPVVSNIQVSDRRTDINFACDVATFDPSLGVTIESIPLKTGGVDIMKPFDLVIYPFNPITNTTITGIKSNTDGYNNSFSFLEQSKINRITTRLENVDEYKTISHSFKTLADGDITSIQNYYELTATISTTAKVNALEQADIIANIYSALAKEFNARKLNFGHEIPFDELLTTMENADARIKSVNLQEPIQTPKIITRTGDGPIYSENVHDIYDDENDSNEFKFIVAKNVLGGRVSLYEYDLDFKYSYDYSTIEQVSGVKRVTTLCNIDDIPPDGTYELKSNEVLQFLAPNLITDKIYTTGINYYLALAGAVNNIPENTDYQLKTGEVIKFYYKQNDIWKCNTFSAGSIINSKTELFTTAYRTQSRLPDIEYAGDSYFGLLSGQEVSIKKINKEEIIEPKKCYWITNELDNEIKWVDDEYILQENEYFFYSDLNLTSLVAFGSGTKLTRASEGMETGWDWKCEADINIDDITLEGLYALTDAFKSLEFSQDNKLTIVENEILTLTAGDTIKNDSSSGDFSISDNVFNPIGTVKLKYKYKTESEYKDLVDKSTIEGGNWSSRSLLDINCGPELEQVLVGNQEVYYTIHPTTLIDIADQLTYSGPLQAPHVLKFNILMQRGGGANINLGYITINNLEQEVYPTLLSITKALNYDAITQTSDGMYVPNFDGGNIAEFYASQIDGSTSTPYMMIYASGVESGSEPAVSAYDSNGAIAGSTVALAEGINIIELEADGATHWELTKGGGSDTLFTISPIKYVKGINPLLGLKTSLSDFIAYMDTNFHEQYAEFYSIADLDPSKEIELSVDYPLNHAQAFYDSNNVANKWVLPKIDFSTGKIKIVIARSSTK